MARFRRPELEKDNPMAPQVYVGRRRRSARSRDMSSSGANEQGRLEETLNTLTEAAERFVNGVPRLKRLGSERDALLDAITQAQLLLSVERVHPKSSRSMTGS